MFVRALARPYIPAYDPIQRAKVRRLAAGLVTVSKWSDDSSTSSDAAQLAVLRLLDLERLTRRSARFRQHEAAALLARTSIDVCITGIACCFDPASVERLTAESAKSMGTMLRFLVEMGAFTEEIESAAIASIGEPRRPQPLWTTVQNLEGTLGAAISRSLYDRIYGPVSSFFAHGSGMALARHVGPGGKVQSKPRYPWNKRSPAHTSAACLGILCGVLVGEDDPNFEIFDRFWAWHWSRVAPVLIAIGGKGLLGTLKGTRLPAAYRALLDLVSYVEVGEHSEPLAERQEYVRRKFREMFSAVTVGVADEVMDAFADMIVANDELEREEPDAT